MSKNSRTFVPSNRTTMSKKKTKETQTRQEAAIEYITSNYLYHNRLRHDVISNKVQINGERETVMGDGLPVTGWRDIADSDINDMVCACAEETGAAVTSREILTVLHSHYVPHIHPLREYVEACTDWEDGDADWLKVLSEHVQVEGGEEEQALWCECFRKWFVAMVASWLHDDAVNQQVLVLVGRQGIFKTTWLEHLLPPQLRPYGCKMANNSQLNKDERLRIAEYGLIALDEIDAMTPRELNVMKSVITASDISERAAYGYTKERRIRLASFCASGNKEEFLTDVTGNRRWLPFKVKSIINPFNITLPYQKIYSQARYLAQNGFKYWFDMDDIEVLEAHNEDFRAQENEEQLLSVYFDIPAEGKGQFMTTAEISDKLVTYGNIKRPMSMVQLGMLLQRNGFRKKAVNHGKQRGWLVYERSMEDINSNRNFYAREGDRVTG